MRTRSLLVLIVVAATRLVLAEEQVLPLDGVIAQQSPPLTLEDAEQLALASHPALAESLALVRAAQGAWLQVGLKPNPVVGYAGNEIGDAGKAGQQGAYISQDLITAGKLQLNRQVASRDVQRAQQNFAATRLRVLSDVRIAFYKALISQHRVQTSKQLVDIGQEAVRTAQLLFQAQEGTQIAELQARTEAQAAELQLQNSYATERMAWRELAAVIGVAELAPAKLAGRPDETIADLAGDATLG